MPSRQTEMSTCTSVTVEKDADSSYRVLESGRRKSITRGRFHRALVAHPRLGFFVIMLVCMAVGFPMTAFLTARSLLRAYGVPHKMRVAHDFAMSSRVDLMEASSCVWVEALHRMDRIRDEMDRITREWQSIVEQDKLTLKERGDRLTRCELGMGDHLQSLAKALDPTSPLAAEADCVRAGLADSSVIPISQRLSEKPSTGTDADAGAASWLARVVLAASTDELWESWHVHPVSTWLMIMALATDARKTLDESVDKLFRSLDPFNHYNRRWENDSAQLEDRIEDVLTHAELVVHDRVDRILHEIRRNAAVDRLTDLDLDRARDFATKSERVFTFEHPTTDSMLPPLTGELDTARTTILVVQKMNAADPDTHSFSDFWRRVDSAIHSMLHTRTRRAGGYGVVSCLLAIQLALFALPIIPLTASLFTEAYTVLGPLDVRDMVTVQSLDDFWAIVRAQHNVTSVLYLILTDGIVFIDRALRFIMWSILYSLGFVSLVAWKTSWRSRCSSLALTSSSPSPAPLNDESSWDIIAAISSVSNPVNKGEWSLGIDLPHPSYQRQMLTLISTRIVQRAADRLRSSIENITAEEERIVRFDLDRERQISELDQIVNSCRDRSQHPNSNWTVMPWSSCIGMETGSLNLSSIQAHQDVMTLTFDADQGYDSSLDTCLRLEYGEWQYMTVEAHYCARESVFFLAATSCWIFITIMLAAHVSMRMVLHAMGLAWWRYLSRDRVSFVGFCFEDGTIDPPEDLPRAVRRYLRHLKWRIGGRLAVAIIVVAAAVVAVAMLLNFTRTH